MTFKDYVEMQIPEGKVAKITAGDTVLWVQPKPANIPREYQEVEWIRAAKNVGAYIDLGFAFDTAATIYIEAVYESAPQFLSSGEQTYLFGAANSSGVYRCMLTAPENNNGAQFYGSTGSTYIAGIGKALYAGKNRLKLVSKKGDLHWENLDTGTVSSKRTDNAAFTMTDHLYLLAQNYKGTARFNNASGHARCVGRFSYYDKNNSLICDIYPCYRKSDGVIGMYDKARGLFLTNAGTGSFTKGANV